MEENERVPLEIPDILKQRLEEDHKIITQQNKLVSLPAQPSVISVLEDYVRHYATTHLEAFTDKVVENMHHPGRNLEKIVHSINLCKEVVDGLRIYFDFTLGELLLYNQEEYQYQQIHTLKPARAIVRDIKRQLKLDSSVMDNGNVIQQETKDKEDLPEEGIAMRTRHRSGEKSPVHAVQPVELAQPVQLEEQEITEESEEAAVTSKRVLRSHKPVVEVTEVSTCVQPQTTEDTKNKTKCLRSTSHTLRERGGSEDGSVVSGVSNKGDTPATMNLLNHISSSGSTSSGRSTPTNVTSSTTISPSCQASMILNELNNWCLIPETLYEETPPTPSLIYGAIHLLRLFVKLPELLYRMNIPDKKLKVLLKHLDAFLEYLSGENEIFEAEAYMDCVENGVAIQ